jgi:UDP-N-acetylmuramoyl-tripeptide--D-alanyl-D-alanine ligase
MEKQRDGATMGKNILWSGVEIAAAVNGRWISGDPQGWGATGVCYYANQVIEGDVVFTVDPQKWGKAYKDTTDKIPKLFASGAVAVITDKLGSNLASKFPILLVKDTRNALDDLGKAARNRFNGKVICVTGSVGKSSTKEGLRHVLSQQAPTAGSRKNFNHGPGVPLSLAQTPPDFSYGVYEFSVDLPKVTLLKAKIARPHVVIVTHIQPDHLLYYPSLEAIADQKSLLFDALAPDGVVVLNRDAPQFERLINNAKQKGIKRILTFGEALDADVQLVKCELREDLSYVSASVNGKKFDYIVGVPGRHMVLNSLAILAGVEAVNADSEKAATALASLQPLPNHTTRHQIKINDGKFEVIDDTFSANSGSIKAALEYLQLIKPEANGRRLAVLGEIQELGEMSRQVHADLATHVLANDIEKVFTIGDGMLALRALLPGHKLGVHAKAFNELMNAVVEEVRGGD